jgi:hypothetical protein
MDSHKIDIKFFLKNPSAIEPEALKPVFHSWIQNSSIPNHVLIDVADYVHVSKGPGVVLVTHEANFAFDLGEGRPGIFYFRQRPLPGTFRQRLRAISTAALEACTRIEEAIPKARFKTDEVLLRINDRLLAPNTQQTFAAVEPAMREFFTGLFAGPVRFKQRLDAHRPFEAAVHATNTAGSAADLLSRVQ